MVLGDIGNSGLPVCCERKRIPLGNGLLAERSEHLTKDGIGGEGGGKGKNHLHGVHRIGIEGAGETGDASGGSLQVNGSLGGEGSGEGGTSIESVGRRRR